jgi:hypothetical protein
MNKTTKTAIIIERKCVAAFVAAAFAILLFFTIPAPVWAATPAEESGVTPVSADLTGNAGDLKLVTSYPPDGSTNLQAQNVGIKLYFDSDVSDSMVQKANEGCFKFTYLTAKNNTKELPVRAVFDSKGEKNYILAIVDTSGLNNNMLANNKAYTLTIEGALTSVDGKTLGEDKVLNFKTVDQSASTKIYMLLMVAMIGAMIGMTILQNRRKAKAAEEVAAKGGKVNPYKLAKGKNISVKEAMELIEHDRQRRAKRLGLEAGKDAKAAEAAAAAPRDTKRVKRPRPISEVGSTYRTGRKDLVEKRAKETVVKFEKAQAAKKSNKNTKAKSKSKRKSKKK